MASTHKQQLDEYIEELRSRDFKYPYTIYTVQGWIKDLENLIETAQSSKTDWLERVGGADGIDSPNIYREALDDLRHLDYDTYQTGQAFSQYTYGKFREREIAVKQAFSSGEQEDNEKRRIKRKMKKMEEAHGRARFSFQDAEAELLQERINAVQEEQQEKRARSEIKEQMKRAKARNA